MGIRITVRSRWSDAPGGDESPLSVYNFEHGRIRIGRGRTADILLPHPAVSALHASLEPQGAVYALTDEDSTNGVLVNGARIAPGRAKSLRHGDHVELGGFTLRVELIPAVATVTSANETAALARRLVREVLAHGKTPLSEPCLHIQNGTRAGESITLAAPPSSLRLGRSEACEVQLDDADLSREHAEVVRDLDGVLVRDLESKNPLAVNGRVYAERRLVDRDELRLGSTILTFEDPAGQALAQIQAAADLPVDLAPDSLHGFDDSPEGPDAKGEDSEPGLGQDDPALTDIDATPSAPEWDGPISEDSQVAIADTAPERRAGALRPRRESAALTDMLIYVLAGAVLGLSALGLWLLTRGG